MSKCNKCDEEGNIRVEKNGAIYGRSCDCGKYQKVIKKKFDKMFNNPMTQIEDLLAYGRARALTKGKIYE